MGPGHENQGREWVTAPLSYILLVIGSSQSERPSPIYWLCSMSKTGWTQLPLMPAHPHTRTQASARSTPQRRQGLLEADRRKSWLCAARSSANQGRLVGPSPLLSMMSLCCSSASLC